ncbi:MAG: hypothetical protein V9E86_11745 [Nitrosomonas sp.]
MLSARARLDFLAIGRSFWLLLGMFSQDAVMFFYQTPDAIEADLEVLSL